MTQSFSVQSFFYLVLKHIFSENSRPTHKMLKDTEAKKCILQTCKIAKTRLHSSRFCHQNYCELLGDENGIAFWQWQVTMTMTMKTMTTFPEDWTQGSVQAAALAPAGSVIRYRSQLVAGWHWSSIQWTNFSENLWYYFSLLCANSVRVLLWRRLVTWSTTALN